MGMLDAKVLKGDLVGSVSPAGVQISDDERRVLSTVLDRQRTSLVVHGGLKGLLGLSSADADVLLDFLSRICS